MAGEGTGVAPSRVAVDRRETVLESALVTFARFGYRKASMEQVAQDAGISRPGLYFMFTSKEDLFRTAVSQALERDLAAVGDTLLDTDRSLPVRLLDSFDHWAGRYIGPMVRDIAGVVEDNPDLLGTMTDVMPARFADLVTRAITAGLPLVSTTVAEEVAQTLISTSVGVKQQVATRDEYLARMTVAIRVVLR